jgi:poly(A) polymerase
MRVTRAVSSKIEGMVPVVVPRGEHTLSRRDVDPDALKVLYRLKEAGFKAYLVGGGVRDLLLGRQPKDFDIGTDAHPHQIKRLFRNSWIIGRRFRLVHVKFGTKVIEVATFRRQVDAADTPPADAEMETPHESGADPRPGGPPETPHAADEPSGSDHPLHRDNTFGTDEEDAFRRDFTINALFYDIASFSIIDYVGGLDDLKAGVIRCIGDPHVRFPEDPVRMQRAVSFAARLGFTLDPPVAEAIRRLGPLLARAAPSRLMDEYYKILRTGAASRIFEALRQAGLLKVLAPRLHEGAAAPEFERSLSSLDAFRQSFDGPPETLTNAILVGSLMVPMGFSQAAWPAWMEQEGTPGLNLGLVPLARRDVERLHQMLTLQRRLREPSRSGYARRTLMARAAFAEALTWLEIHGDAPDVLAYWLQELAASPAAPEEPEPRRRRRRRRSGRGRQGGFEPPR